MTDATLLYDTRAYLAFGACTTEGIDAVPRFVELGGETCTVRPGWRMGRTFPTGKTAVLFTGSDAAYAYLVERLRANEAAVFTLPRRERRRLDGAAAAIATANA